MKTQLHSSKTAGVGFGAEAVGGFPGCIGRAGRLPVAPSALATGAGGEFPAGRVSFSGKVAEVRGEMAFFPVGMPSELAAPTSELVAPTSELVAPASEFPAGALLWCGWVLWPLRLPTTGRASLFLQDSQQTKNTKPTTKQQTMTTL
jgi:hypothetical protein